MPETHSRAGKRVERFSVTDEPHERYQGINPFTGEELNIDNLIPILKTVDGGQIIQKDITYYTVDCPECNQPAEYTHDSEPVCPCCGIICSGPQGIQSERIVRDAKSAGRLDN